MRVLLLGIKDWPYGYSSKFEQFPGGGIGRYTSNLVYALSDDVQFLIITRRFPGQLKYEREGKIEVIRVNFINNKFLRLPSFAFFSTIKALKYGTFDIVHAHGLFSILAAFFIGKMKKCSILGTPHGSNFNQHKGFIRLFFQIIESRIYPRVSKLIFLSDQEKNTFEIKYSSFPNQVLIPSGIDIKHSYTVKSISKDILLLFVGRLVPVKRINNVIMAISELDAEYQKHIHFEIVGDGYEYKKLYTLVKELNLSEKVSFLGFNSDVERYYMRADVFILPSDSESFPVSLLEAMSYGLPSIISNLDIPISDKSVLKMKNNSVNSIKSALMEFVDNLELRKALSKSAYHEVKNKFSYKNIAEKHLNIYSELCN